MLTERARGAWVGSWTSSPLLVEDVNLHGRTPRMIARLSIGGSTWRIRVSNAFGSRRLTIGAAHLALRGTGARILPETDRPITFGGSPSTVISAGALMVSDPVELHVPPLADVAVSLYLPDSASQPAGFTGHGNAHQTSYISPPGDFTASPGLPVEATTDAFLLLSGVEVMTPESRGVVAFGDSLTDGNLTELDANGRWPDQLARRLAARSGGRPVGVMNQGIGGNRILHDGRGDSALRRFDRDVLAQPGVTHVITLLGINDIRNRNQRPEEAVSANEMIAGLHQLIVRAHARGVKIFGGTLLTFEHETFNPGFYSEEGEAKRQAVNAWIRQDSAFDAVIDFEKALRDPSHPTRMLAEFDCGDHLHPSAAGYARMGDCIDLSLFD